MKITITIKKTYDIKDGRFPPELLPQKKIRKFSFTALREKMEREFRPIAAE